MAQNRGFLNGVMARGCLAVVVYLTANPLMALESFDLMTVQFVHKCSRHREVPPEPKEIYSQGEVSNIWVWSMQAGVCSGYWRAVAESQDYLTDDVCAPSDQHPYEQVTQGEFEEFREFAGTLTGRAWESAQIAIMEFRRMKWPCNK